MAPDQKNGFGENEMGKKSTQRFRMARRTVSRSSVAPPGLRTLRRAGARLGDELGGGDARWGDDELVPDTPLHGLGSSPDVVSQTPPITTAWDDDEDIFVNTTRTGQRGTQHDALEGNGEGVLATQLESLDLSPTNRRSPNRHLSPRSPAFPPRTPTHAVDIAKSKDTSPDPRHLFGSEGTHLPWIQQVSPKEFSQTIPQGLLSPNSPPAKKTWTAPSIWEASEEEFDRWPTATQARDEVDSVRRTATLKRHSFVKREDPDLSVSQQIQQAITTPMDGIHRSVDEQEQLLLELGDMDCGNPWGRDAHDDIIALFRSKNYTALPAQAPARHMHVLDAEAYLANPDPVAKAARPRLCDAVATVLAYTNPECLEAFLDPEVEVFEWRRLGNCVMIRREGREVVVGNYYNFGTTYQWGYLVRSTIDAEGAWSETYASTSQGATPVTKDRVLFEEFEADGTGWDDVEPDDEEFALYMGRELSRFLLRWSVWDYGTWWKYRIEWEVDGKVTNARDRCRYPVGLLQ